MAYIDGATSSTGWKLRLNYDVSQSIANNTSTLKLTLQIYDGTGLSYNQDSGSCYYTLQGTTVYNPYRYESKGWYTLGSKTITVDHADDGTGSVKLSADWHSGFSSSFTPASLSVSETVILTTIPRASTVSGTLTLGSAGVITVKRASTDFTHTIKLTCGKFGDTLCTKSTVEGLTFTPPLYWATNNVNGTTVDITAITTTYNGDTVIGTTTNVLPAAIPASVTPTLSISLADTTGYKDTYGWVQSKSKLKVTYTASGAQGSTIVSKTLLIAGKTANPDGENAINASGSVTVVATVADTRGRTASASATITVKAYSPPTISGLTFVRGTYSSNTWSESANGSDLKVTLASTVSVSTATITFYADSTEKTQLLNQSSGSKTAYLTDFGTDVTRQLRVKAEDAFGGSVTKEITVPTVAVILNLNFENMSACFGGVAEREKSVEFKLPVYFQDSFLDLLHPVGSIYTSTKPTPPDELFGGRWAQIKDVFLMAAGDKYTAGTKGCAASTALSSTQLSYSVVYAWRRLGENEPSYINQIPISTDTDGSVYGWKKGYSLNGSGETVATSSVYVTGFIPMFSGDTVRFADMNLVEGASTLSENRVAFYDANKTLVKAVFWTGIPNLTYTDGYLTSLVVPSYSGNEVAYARFSCYWMSDASVITVNETIT